VQWINEPQQWQQQGSTISVTADRDTDFWRVTRHDFIKDDAHFYYQEVTGDFTATVKVTGEYNALYDQAGLMVRENERVWLKCGIEYLNGVQQASAVTTRDFSDWSIVPLPDNPTSIWVQVSRFGSALEVSYSRTGEDFTLIRQSYLTETATLKVGLLLAAPKGDGFAAHFEQFNIVQG
jgi:uncharacterized protein